VVVLVAMVETTWVGAQPVMVVLLLLNLLISLSYLTAPVVHLLAEAVAVQAGAIEAQDLLKVEPLDKLVL
jgi:hypothetical protein